jgi:REP element-mobilizing transposase RayT
MEDNRSVKRYKSVRLPEYDYSSAGGYSVTMVSTSRECLFGTIADGEIRLNELGLIVRSEWLLSSDIREEVVLDEFVVMPNHFHAIVFLKENAHCRAALPSRNSEPHKRERQPRSLSTLISGFKASSTRCINKIRNTSGQRVWQPSFHEHIIRNDKELAQLREYIVNNPLKWHLDTENPERLNHDPQTTR